jgi:Putative DNA-binding domain
VNRLSDAQLLRDDRAEHRRSLLLRPRESFAVELKSWFDQHDAYGVAKIVKTILALRNQNGGYLVVGIDDKTLKPIAAPPGFPPVRECFHPDAIQQIVSKYASQSFEVTVDLERVDGHEHPVISIPTGIVTPVLCRADLKSAEGQFLLREGDIYVRTLGANGRISSARMSWQDIPDLFNRCFDNREADHVRFFSKLLPGFGPELASLLQSVPTRAKPDAQMQKETLERGVRRFGEIANERKLDVRSFGFWDVALHHRAGANWVCREP